MLAISVDGQFFPCIRYMQYTLGNRREQMILGNVDDGIEDRDKNKYRILLAGITRKSQSTEECFNCNVARGCAWCSAYNYDVFGTPNKRATFICGMHKVRCAASYYYFTKLYKKLNIDQLPKLYLTKKQCLRFMSEEEYNNLINL